MINYFKKIISLLMIGVLAAVATVPLMASSLTSNGFEYTVDDNGATITGFVSNTADIVIPEEINGYNVVSIGKFAFADRLNKYGVDISSLTLPETLKTIEDGAFSVNSSVKTLNIPASVESIGALAFHSWLKLSTITFNGSSLKTIDYGAFRNCQNLISMSLPESVEDIGDYSFAYCVSLSTVTFPKSVSRIGSEAFLACKSLSIALVKNENTAFGENVFDITSVDADDKTAHGLTIYGYSGSAAQQYASSNSYDFIAFTEEEDNSTSGSYYIKITYEVTGSNPIKGAYKGFNSEANDTAGISVLYRDINGVSNEDKQYDWDVKSTMAETGEYSISASISGFPRLLYAYLDDNRAGSGACFRIKKLEVGSSGSDLKTVWTGVIQVRSQFNAYGVSTDWDGNAKVDYFGTDSNNIVSDSSGEWSKPYAANITAQYNDESISFISTSNNISNEIVYSAYDQYNVALDYSLCTISSVSSESDNNEYIINNIDNGICSTTVSRSAHLYEIGNNIQTIKTSFIWKCKDKVVSKDAFFNLNDEEYLISWMNSDGEALNTKYMQYGELPDYDLPEKQYDARYHYSGGEWTPEVTQVTEEATYIALYTAQIHDFSENVITEATCAEEGLMELVCNECGYSRRQDIPKKDHSYTLKIISADTLCSPANETDDAVYYYTCENCGTIGVNHNDWFEVRRARIFGRVDTANQFKSISVSLIKGEKVVDTRTVSVNSEGLFAFYDLEAGDYQLEVSGNAKTVTKIKNISLVSGQQLDLKSESSAVNNIKVAIGDINGDGTVDIADISGLLSAKVYGIVKSDNINDINNDNIVTIDDLNIIIHSDNYGKTSNLISLV